MIDRVARASVILAALVFFLDTPFLTAQSWVPVGPPGGDVRALAADPRDPRRVYLGTSDGVLYRSEDAGLRWQRLSPGFPKRGMSLDSLVVDPRGTLYVGYWSINDSGGGVARSTDGGRTVSLLPGIDGQSVRTLAVAPSNANILVVGTMTRVLRSMDAGRTWQPISPADNADIRYLHSVAIDPQDPDVLYIGTWHLPWKTTDGGKNWTPINAGMIDDSDVMTLTVDRRNPQSVFATACSGIYRSSDAAARWTRIRGIPSSSRRTRAFAQSPDRLDVFFAGTTEGLWMSEDGSNTWRLATVKDVSITSVLPLAGGVVLLGSEGAGVLRSTDEGGTWRTSNQGFSERFVSRIVFDTASRRMLAGVWGDRRYGGVFAASGARGPWTRLGPGLEGREVLALAMAGSSALAGTDDGLFAYPGPDGAWRRLPTVIAGIDVHPRVNDVVASGPQAFLVATTEGVLRTLDGGGTWSRPVLGPWGDVSALAITPRQPGLVLAAAPLGFFRSTDGGEHWTLVSKAFGDARPHGLSFLPTDPKVVLAPTSEGLFRSADQGRTWTRCGAGIPHTDITGLAMSPDGRTLYASDFTWGGVFRSMDGGEFWERLPADGLITDRIWTVAVDPSAPDRVFAASSTGGLHLLVAPAADVASGGSP
jgi:photosystem II stability/assembly factor-like uncharacterized protein